MSAVLTLEKFVEIPSVEPVFSPEAIEQLAGKNKEFQEYLMSINELVSCGNWNAVFLETITFNAIFRFAKERGFISPDMADQVGEIQGMIRSILPDSEAKILGGQAPDLLRKIPKDISNIISLRDGLGGLGLRDDNRRRGVVL